MKKNIIFIIVFTILITITFSGCSFVKYNATDFKGVTSKEYLNSGNDFDIYWGEDDNGIYTKFYDKNTNGEIIILGNHTQILPDISFKTSNEILLAIEKALVVADAVGKIVSVDNSGIIEIGEK